MPEFATGGIISRSDDEMLPLLQPGYCSYLWLADPEHPERLGLLDRINRGDPLMDVEMIEQQVVDAVTEVAEKITGALSLPSFAVEVVEILRPQLHDVAVALAQKLDEES